MTFPDLFAGVGGFAAGAGLYLNGKGLGANQERPGVLIKEAAKLPAETGLKERTLPRRVLTGQGFAMLCSFYFSKKTLRLF
jgi:hypothetical protein